MKRLTGIIFGIFIGIVIGTFVSVLAYDTITPTIKYPTGKAYKEVIELRETYTITATDTVKIVIGEDDVYTYTNDEGEYIMFTVNSAIAVFDVE